VKKLQIIAWISLLLGLIMKFPHYPGASLLLLIGTLLLFIHSILFFIKNIKTNLPDSFLHFAFSIWTVYLLCRIKYWSCGPMILGYSLMFIISVVISITALILYFRDKTKIALPQILLIIYFLFSVWVSFIHSDKIYYFFNLNEITQMENRNENYKSWDKYSWFLYIDEKQDEALNANLNAQQIIEEKLKISQDEYLLNELNIIKEHNVLIQNKNWIDYR
jgi:hypothetical protein